MPDNHISPDNLNTIDDIAQKRPESLMRSQANRQAHYQTPRSILKLDGLITQPNSITELY